MYEIIEGALFSAINPADGSKSHRRQLCRQSAAEILAMKAQGQEDLVVRFLSGIPIQDLGDRTGFRLNRCAAALYGVNSIVAVPVEGE